MKARCALWAAALVVGAAVAQPAPAGDFQEKRPRNDYTSGAYLFKTFCVSCHGERGRGDGPASELLRTRPGDLTRLAERFGGVYPRDRVYAVIAGRTPVPGHDRGEMPAFADVLRITEGPDERVVKQRIDGLVAHLESLQVKP